MAFRAVAATFGTFAEMDDAVLPEITAPYAGPGTEIQPRSEVWEVDSFHAAIEASAFDDQRFVPVSQFRAY